MSVYDSSGEQHLQAEIDSVREDLDSLKTYELTEVKDSIEAIKDQASALESRLEETESDLSDTGHQLEDLTSTMKQIKTSVAWLERHIRSSDAAEVADLDTVGPDLRTAARLAEAGAAAQAKLLRQDARDINQLLIQSHQDAVAAQKAAFTALLSTTGTLADLPWNAPRHTAARASYRTAKQNLAEAQARLKRTAAPAEKARQELAADDLVRAEHASTIDTGQKNATTLLTRLRTRIADAVLKGGLLMPVWLHDQLGPMPAEGQSAQWVDVATQILAYRITYNDQDPLIALGDVPANASARRKTWAATITRDISRLRD